MDKEKEIEEMATLIRDENYRMFSYHDEYIRTPYDIAKHLILEAGYGNVKQAVKEFAETLKIEFYREFEELIPSVMADKIDRLIKDICGEDL